MKDLEKLIKLLRRTGVASFKADGVELSMGNPPKSAYKAINVPQDPLANVSIPQPNIKEDEEGVDKIASTDELTEDQLLFYSARPEDFENRQ